jgi:4-amino-4-deoxy-L-arabinose transferase-like glycosyltransferase
MQISFPIHSQNSSMKQESNIITPHRRRVLSGIAWLGLVILYFIAGTIGHDPWWKHGETYSFGIINHFYQTGTWLVPMNAGTPFMEKPPLFFWTGEVMCQLFGGVLPLPDAARLASIFYMLVTIFAVWKSSQLLFARHHAHKSLEWTCLWLFLGSYGLAWYGHALATDVALMAGTALALYGMTLLICAPHRWRSAGWWLGLGIGIAFMSKGLIVPGVLCLSGILLWIILPELRTRQTFHAIALASIIAAPFVFIWPILLYQNSPALFMEWFWQNNVGRFLGFSVPVLGAENRPLYFLYVAPIFAFPSFPLACAESIIAFRKASWRQREHLLPLVVAVVGMVVLLISASGRRVYLLPLLPAFSLLAAPALLRIPSRFLRIWNMATRICFSISALGIWVLWWILRYPPETRPLAWYANYFATLLPLDYSPGYSQPVACAAALMAALFWVVLLRLKPGFHLKTARIWFAGTALIWCTAFTLLLPWVDETRTYRPLFKKMMIFVNNSPYAHECIGNYNLGENVAPMLEDFIGKTPPAEEFDHPTCHLILTRASTNTPEAISSHWRFIWRGSRTRPSDVENEELRLYLYGGDAK